jgi:hypothetical protein
MFYHELYPDGPRRIVVKCEWLDSVEESAADDHTSMLPQASKNPNCLMNATDSFAFLDECAAYNIMLCRHDPMDAQCIIYDIIDRHRIFEDKV